MGSKVVEGVSRLLLGATVGRIGKLWWSENYHCLFVIEQDLRAICWRILLGSCRVVEMVAAMADEWPMIDKSDY